MKFVDKIEMLFVNCLHWFWRFAIWGNPVTSSGLMDVRIICCCHLLSCKESGQNCFWLMFGDFSELLEQVNFSLLHRPISSSNALYIYKSNAMTLIKWRLNEIGLIKICVIVTVTSFLTVSSNKRSQRCAIYFASSSQVRRQLNKWN